MQELRSFLYLDEALLAEYLAALEGMVSKGTIQQTTERSGKGGGSLGIGPVKAEGERGVTQTSSGEYLINHAAKFQRLYELVGDNIKFIQVLDEEIFSSIQLGDIVEIRSSIMLPDILQAAVGIDGMGSVIEQMLPIRDLFPDQFDNNQLDENIAVLNQAQSLFKLANAEEIPVAFFPLDGDDFESMAILQRNFLKTSLPNIQTEATIFGKVKKIIQRDTQEPLYSGNKATELLLSLADLQGKTRRERRALERKAKEAAASLDSITGPGFSLIPLAIYQ